MMTLQTLKDDAKNNVRFRNYVKIFYIKEHEEWDAVKLIMLLCEYV